MRLSCVLAIQQVHIYIVQWYQRIQIKFDLFLHMISIFINELLGEYPWKKAIRITHLS